MWNYTSQTGIVMILHDKMTAKPNTGTTKSRVSGHSKPTNVNVMVAREGTSRNHQSQEYSSPGDHKCLHDI